ncbi:energy transducer TonB [bacterium]|nr:energy transducer TonB [bacterium]
MPAAAPVLAEEPAIAPAQAEPPIAASAAAEPAALLAAQTATAASTPFTGEATDAPQAEASAEPPAPPAAPPSQAAPAFPSPQEVLDLLSNLIAERKAYPESARRRKAQGAVGLVVELAPDGGLAAVRVEKKSGSAILDRAALNLVKGLFPMALRPGEPMEIALTIEYRLVP